MHYSKLDIDQRILSYLSPRNKFVMRILLLAPRFPAISETFVLRHVLGLMERDVEVWVLAVPGDLQLLGRDTEKSRMLLNRMLPVEPLLGSGMSPLMKAISLLPRKFASLKLVGLTMLDLASKRGGLGNRRTLSMARSLREAPRFDLVHAQHGQSALSAARLIKAGFLEGPLVSTFHGSDLNVNRSRSNEFLYRPVWKSSVLCTAGTRFMASHFQKANLRQDRYRVIPVGVDMGDFCIPKLPKSSKDAFRLVTIGRLVPVKGTEYAIRTVPLLQQRGFNVVLDVIGSGELQEELEALAEELGVSNRVIFHGGLPFAKTKAILAQADVLVHPGIIDPKGQQEGQGLVLAEAQALEVPVVASSVGGIPEVVCDGKSAILVPQKCPLSIADGVERLFRNPELANQMGVFGRAYVADNFNMEKIMDGWLEIYRGIIRDS